ncbi:MAG: heterodisulfide reductase subunit [Candidatus Atribacteria bacterium]|uniref:FAD-dependent oxidoreductase n=1 Tax=Atrimonas thermophila TaxID=3064161 RepID=UPI0024AA969D|nr:heterodisulfide reductase subunit [Candidatus Atribacteria bacterium]MDI3530280.1 heterodisulfide reductase subunit [Candidatus Atribacteria bacterium]
MECDFLIVGAGPAGLAVGKKLSAYGRVRLLEKNDTVGGLAATLGCKAHQQCLYCGICRNVDLSRQIGDLRSLVLYPRDILKVTRFDAGFQVATNCEEIRAKYVVIASGAEPFDARKVPSLGYGRLEGVLSGLDVERSMNDGRVFELFPPQGRVAFIQCVGSRNFKEKRGYCSQICCRYALRALDFLRYFLPGLEFTMFYMDLQIFGAKSDYLWEVARNKVSLIRSIPFRVEGENGSLEVFYENERAKVIKEKFDRVVLSIGLSPGSSTKNLARIFGLELDEWGFIRNFGGGRTSNPGVFVCGTAGGPKDVETTIFEACQVAENILEIAG